MSSQFCAAPETGAAATATAAASAEAVPSSLKTAKPNDRLFENRWHSLPQGGYAFFVSFESATPYGGYNWWYFTVFKDLSWTFPWFFGQET